MGLLNVGEILFIGSRYQQHSRATTAIMPSEAVLNLSFLELLQALNETVISECTRVQEIRLPNGVASVTALKAEVSTSRFICLNQSCGQV